MSAIGGKADITNPPSYVRVTQSGHSAGRTTKQTCRYISFEVRGTIRRNVAMTEYSTVKNLGAVFDTHVKAEFIDKDVAATMATMVAEPYLTHVPTLTGGTGRSEVERFMAIISLAIGLTMLRSNHCRAPSVRTCRRRADRQLYPRPRNARLPSRRAADRSEGCVATCRSDGFRRSRSRRVRTHLLGSSVASGAGWITRSGLLPVAGVEQAKRLLDPTQPANEMIERLRLSMKQQ